MQITKVETIHVDEFWQMCWVRIHTDSGEIGLGETWYLPKSVAAVVHELFGPTLIGRDPMDREGIWDELFKLAGIFTYSGAELRALSAIDIALWDIVGQALDQPIYNLLGGKSRDKIRIYNTIGSYGEWQDNEFEQKDPVGFLQSLIDDGITAVKAYYMAPYAAESGGNMVTAKQIKEGLAPLAKQRKVLGDQIEIAHDGGGQWALAPAIRITKAMDEYDMLWQEEMIHPVNAEAHLRLAQETKAPICAAERLMTRFEFREYIENGSAEIVMPDLIWTGGISETKNARLDGPGQRIRLRARLDERSKHDDPGDEPRLLPWLVRQVHRTKHRDQGRLPPRTRRTRTRYTSKSRRFRPCRREYRSNHRRQQVGTHRLQRSRSTCKPLLRPRHPGRPGRVARWPTSIYLTPMIGFPHHQ
jgi:L-alanine-DL-glutamate epimerase-like enolase superfamily enzyme